MMAEVRAPQPHPSVLAWNLATRSPATATTPARSPTSTRMARELHADDPGRLVALDVWGAHPPGRPARSTARSTPSASRTTSAGTRTLTRRRGSCAAGQGEAQGCSGPSAGKVLVVTEFGAEGNRATPAGAR